MTGADPSTKLTTGSSHEVEKSDAAASFAHDELVRRERQAMTMLAAASVGVVTLLVAPLGVGILLGTLIAFSLQPLYERWKPRLGATLASLSTILVAVVVLGLAFGGLVWLLVAKGTSLARSMMEALGPSGEARGIVTAFGSVTARVGIGPDQLQDRLRALAGTAAERAASAAEMLLAATAAWVLALFFAVLTTHYILVNWRSMARRAQETLPIRPAYTLALFEEFRRVGRSTLLGTIVTGLVQGLLATIGYWMMGVPQPLFFGACTSVASLIPGVGTLLVWVPIGIFLLLTRHLGTGILELIWGAAMIVGVSDYVIRPRLVGGAGEMPALVTFIALFGGVETFGLKGLIVGPMLMSLGIAVLRIYAKEMRFDRAADAEIT